MNTNAKKHLKLRTKLAIVLFLAVIAGLFIIFRPAKEVSIQEMVQQKDVTTYYSFSGVIDVKQRENVIADSMMQIKRLYVKEGDKVKKGDILFQTSYGDDVSAGIDGEVTMLDVDLNSQVFAGTRVMQLVNYEDLEVTVKIDEYDIFIVQPGKEVEVTVNALKRTIQGNVSKVSREALNVNGISYFTAIIDLNYDPDILVGMSVELKMIKDSVSKANTVSMQALRFDDYNRAYVMLDDGSGKPKVKYVTVGINDGNIVQILEGLEVGDIVLIE